MSIRVVNLRDYAVVENEVLVKVDRSSVLGNPFRMRDNTQCERDRVCNAYISYFNRKVKEKGNFRNEVIRIYRMVRDGKDVALGYWCAPKRCHAEYIKAFIEKHLPSSDVCQPGHSADKNTAFIKEESKDSSDLFRVEFEFENEEQTWKSAFLDNNGKGFTFEDATAVARQLSHDNVCYKRNINVVKASK